MRTQLVVNDMVVPLNEFTQTFIGNVLRGLSSALGHSGTKISACLHQEGITLWDGDYVIELRTEFARKITKNTVRGMLSSLNGVMSIQQAIITTRE